MGFAPDGKEREVSAIVIHRIEGGKIAEEWREGSGVVLELTRARLEKEIGERERVDQELKVARRIQHASLPEEVPAAGGLADLSLLPASQRGRRRLLRLPPPL